MLGNVSLNELRSRWEREFGPYIVHLSKYVNMAKSNNANSLVHLIYCISQNGNGGLASSYINFISPATMLATELIGVEELRNMMNELL